MMNLGSENLKKNVTYYPAMCICENRASDFKLVAAKDQKSIEVLSRESEKRKREIAKKEKEKAEREAMAKAKREKRLNRPQPPIQVATLYKYTAGNPPPSNTRFRFTHFNKYCHKLR